MSSLRYLSECVPDDTPILASLKYLVQLHVDEGNLEPLATRSPKVAQTPTLQASDVAVANYPPASGLSSSTTKATGRSVAGAVPSMPYTPLSLRHHRRPYSAVQTHGMPPKGASDIRSQVESTPQDTQGTRGDDSSRNQRRSEFVDRWLEKLYFRNPVIVSQKRSSADQSTSTQPPSPRAAPVPAMPARCRSADFHAPRDPVIPPLEVIHVADVREDDEIVAQLPPKPINTHSNAIRQEIMVERLTRCFGTRPSSPAAVRPASPVVRTHVSHSSTVLSTSSSSTVLPSVSTFVERKRRAVE